MKVGILSDTHGVLLEYFIPYLTSCDYLIHAGDLHTQKCSDNLKSLGVPSYIVKGNCDNGPWAKYIPELLTVCIAGKIFYIIHKQCDLPRDRSDADFIIFGHTHQFQTYQHRQKVYINPGSASQSRSGPNSIVILTLPDHPSDPKPYQLERILLKAPDA